MCIDCENYYIETYNTGFCHKKLTEVNREEIPCKYFTGRRVPIIPELVNDIAKILAKGNEAVLLADGFPMVKFNKNEEVTVIEICLRTLCGKSCSFRVVSA